MIAPKRISDLIASLERFESEHGDLVVGVEVEEFGYEPIHDTHIEIVDEVWTKEQDFLGNRICVIDLLGRIDD